MKFRLGPLASDLFIAVYAIASLYLRFKFESQNPISPMNSIVMGISFLVIIWVLIKFKVLNPNWFGFFKSKSDTP